MKNTTKQKVIKISKEIIHSMTYMIKHHMYMPEYPNEQPTRDRIRKTVRQTYRNAYPSLFKTKEQYELAENYVFDRLSRDGTLKYMRPIK